MASIAGRYARAFADVVMERKLNPDQAVQELNQFAALVRESAALRNVLENPSVEHAQKLGLLNAIVKRMGASKQMRNFIAVLIDHKRVGLLAGIASLVKQELEQRMGIAEALISSARPLSEPEKKTLETRLAAVTGKVVRASYSQDASLLGGALVRIGSTIYDGSVRGQLQRLREEIAGQ